MKRFKVWTGCDYQYYFSDSYKSLINELMAAGVIFGDVQESRLITTGIDQVSSGLDKMKQINDDIDVLVARNLSIASGRAIQLLDYIDLADYRFNEKQIDKLRTISQNYLKSTLLALANLDNSVDSVDSVVSGG